MKAIQPLGRAFLIVLAGLTLVHASDFIGVYARIDKVVLEPNSDSPDRIQVWGVFSLLSTNDRQARLPPARGYLYFKLGNPQESPNGPVSTATYIRMVRAEWNDLKQVAGSGQIVAFGLAGQPIRLRKSGEKPESPDPYVTNVGVNKVSSQTDYPLVKALLDYKD